MNPKVSPRPGFRPKGRGMIPMLMQDNSICKFQRTAFLKLGSHYPPLMEGLDSSTCVSRIDSEV